MLFRSNKIYGFFKGGHEIKIMDMGSTENNKGNYHPMKFVDQMERNKHMVLLYDSKEYAYWVIARYFLNGLRNRESCILFTSENPRTIEKLLAKEGDRKSTRLNSS